MKISSPLLNTRVTLLKKTLSGYALTSLLVLLSPSSVLGQTQEATKLQAIANKLNAVPVYYLQQATGQSYTVDAGSGKPSVAPVFFYAASARSLQQDLLSKEPPIETSIVRSRLGDIYLNIEKPDGPDIKHALITDPTQLDAARRISGDERFSATPVFAVRQNKQGGFLTTRDSDGSISLPLFIESQRAFAAMNIMVQRNEDLEDELAVSVMPLQTTVSDMINGRLETEAVLFIPPQ